MTKLFLSRKLDLKKKGSGIQEGLRSALGRVVTNLGKNCEEEQGILYSYVVVLAVGLN